MCVKRVMLSFKSRAQVLIFYLLHCSLSSSFPLSHTCHSGAAESRAVVLLRNELEEKTTSGEGDICRIEKFELMMGRKGKL